MLLEDTGGYMGFDLEGTIQADGLSPFPALGKDQVFECGCRTPSTPASAKSRVIDDDQEVIRQLIKIAEERRLKRAAARDAQQPPKQ